MDRGESESETSRPGESRDQFPKMGILTWSFDGAHSAAPHVATHRKPTPRKPPRGDSITKQEESMRGRDIHEFWLLQKGGTSLTVAKCSLEALKQTDFVSGLEV